MWSVVVETVERKIEVADVVRICRFELSWPVRGQSWFCDRFSRIKRKRIGAGGADLWFVSIGAPAEEDGADFVDDGRNSL
jgi:hypothetical protein